MRVIIFIALLTAWIVGSSMSFVLREVESSSVDLPNNFIHFEKFSTELSEESKAQIDSLFYEYVKLSEDDRSDLVLASVSCECEKGEYDVVRVLRPYTILEYLVNELKLSRSKIFIQIMNDVPERTGNRLSHVGVYIRIK